MADTGQPVNSRQPSGFLKIFSRLRAHLVLLVHLDFPRLDEERLIFGEVEA